MRKQVLEGMRAVLVGRRSSLRAALEGDLSALRSLHSDSSDMADMALDYASEEVTSQMAQVESRELEDIDKALERIVDGSYGCCQQCQQPIPVARLKALPYAEFCIGCQTKFEKIGVADWSTLSGHAYHAT